MTTKLDDKQQSAFNRRIPPGSTAEEWEQEIIRANAQMWADSDYAATSAMLVEKLKDQPQPVLDGIIAQLSSLE